MVQLTLGSVRSGARSLSLLAAAWLASCSSSHDKPGMAAAGTAAASASAAAPSGEPASSSPEPARPSNANTDAAGSAAVPPSTRPPGDAAASGSSEPEAGSGGDATATTTHATATREVIEIEQRLMDVRPEFVDYFWNNLDAEHFEQWFPAEHEAFAWESAPKAPGDLGAESGAAFRSTELIGGQPHELVVRYLDRAMAGDQVTLDYAMVADVTIDGQGPVRWVVEYTTDGDWNLLMKQRLETPSVETPDAFRSHFEQRMANLAGFLKSWFQKDFCEGELMSRGERSVTTIGDPISGDFDIVVTQHIAKIDHDMMDWWWDNIKDTMRYHRWHPIAHQQFTWLTPPKNTMDLEYDVGAVQQIVEIIGDSNTLDIGWLSPANVPIELTYEHYVYGSTMLSGTPFGGFLLHEYADDPERGGINMKSTFRLPALAGEPFAEALAAHCTQEMQFLQYFLPAVFAEEYKGP